MSFKCPLPSSHKGKSGIAEANARSFDWMDTSQTPHKTLAFFCLGRSSAIADAYSRPLTVVNDAWANACKFKETKMATMRLSHPRTHPRTCCRYGVRNSSELEMLCYFAVSVQTLHCKQTLKKPPRRNASAIRTSQIIRLDASIKTKTNATKANEERFHNCGYHECYY